MDLLEFAPRPRWLIAAPLLVTLACTSRGPQSTPDDTGDETTTGTGSQGDSSEGGTSETGEPPTPEEGSCRDLADSRGVMWVEGDELVSTAQSSDARISNAGRQTWQLALKLLRITDPELYPTAAMSPTSMSVAMGMTYGKYDSDSICGTSIHEAMGFDEFGVELHSTLGAAMRELRDRALPEEEGMPRIGLETVPSFWQLDLDYQAPSSELQQLYGGRFHEVAGHDADVRDLMNCVIEQQSDGLLPDFLPDWFPGDAVGAEVNVTALTAPWSVPLVERDAIDFVRENGTVAQLPGVGADFREARTFIAGSFETVELTLRGFDLRVLLVIPNYEIGTSSLADFSSSLTGDAVFESIDMAEIELVNLSMPELEIDSTTIDYYEDLNIDCGQGELGAVLHGASTHWDAKGVKAAAATVNPEDPPGDSGDDPMDPRDIVVDRPFLFFIYDAKTDFVLFNGRFAG